MKYLPKKGDRIIHKAYPDLGIGIVQDDNFVDDGFDLAFKVIYNDQTAWETYVSNMIPLLDPNDLLKEIL